MKYIKFFLIPLSVFVMLASCAEPQETEQTEEVAALDTAQVIASIEELRNNFQAMIANSTYEDMAQMTDKEFMVVGPSGPGWDSIRSMSTETPYPSGTILAISPIETVVINEEWAYEMGNSQLTYTPEGATEAMVLHDTYLMIFRNRGNGWKLYREVASSTLPEE